MRRSTLLAIAVGATLFACPGDEPPPSGEATIEIDNLRTISAVVGGDPLVTAVVTGCSGTPPALTFADGILIHRDEAVVLFRIDGEMDAYPEDALLFTVLIPHDELTPDIYGLPVEFDIEMRVFCDDQWVKSSPYPMVYVPAVASVYPAFNPVRFWASDSDVGDILGCVDTKLVNFVQGITPREELDVGFPCGVTSMSNGLGLRRYLAGWKQDARTKGVGIAAIDPGPTLAWSRPMALVDSWTEPDRDPVVLREVGDVDEILVLDRDTGEDLVGPLSPTHKPLGPIARNANDDILLLESSVTSEPETRTYWVETFDSTGIQIDLLEVAFYNWRAKAYFAAFDNAGEHIYVPAAPDNDDTFWIEKVEISTGATVWTTTSNQPWRTPRVEAAGRVLVASDDQFIWLDIDTGVELSQPFAPDSGNSFLQGFVEEDGSLVLIADLVGEVAPVARSLYIFGPDGSTTLRFIEDSSQFRWLTPAWEGGTLVSYFEEIHWLYTRAGYEFLLE